MVKTFFGLFGFPKLYKLMVRANAYEKLKVNLLYYLYIIISPLRITQKCKLKSRQIPIR